MDGGSKASYEEMKTKKRNIASLSLRYQTPLARIYLCLILVGSGIQYRRTEEYLQQATEQGLIRILQLRADRKSVKINKKVHNDMPSLRGTVFKNR